MVLEQLWFDYAFIQYSKDKKHFSLSVESYQHNSNVFHIQYGFYLKRIHKKCVPYNFNFSLEKRFVIIDKLVFL